MIELLKYADHTDRCYGIAGMVVGITVFDGENYIMRVDTRHCDLEALALTPDFCVVDHPGLSIKGVWRALAGRYRLAAAMVIGNVISRSVNGRRGAVDPDTLQTMINCLWNEASELLDLSEEENRELCLQTYNHLRQAFSHPAVKHILDSIASCIKEKEVMERDEIFELLSPLL